MEKQDHFPKGARPLLSTPEDDSRPDTRTPDDAPSKKHQKPSMYKIWLINDDSIPSDLFMVILREHFHLLKQASVSCFVKLRNDGYINYGRYTKEIAEEKVCNINEFGKIHGYMIKCLSCKDDGHVIKKS